MRTFGRSEEEKRRGEGRESTSSSFLPLLTLEKGKSTEEEEEEKGKREVELVSGCRFWGGRERRRRRRRKEGEVDEAPLNGFGKWANYYFLLLSLSPPLSLSPLSLLPVSDPENGLWYFWQRDASSAPFDEWVGEERGHKKRGGKKKGGEGSGRKKKLVLERRVGFVVAP